MPVGNNKLEIEKNKLFYHSHIKIKLKKNINNVSTL